MTYSNTTCIVCGSLVKINEKHQIAEHKKGGQICYGSFMPENQPKIFTTPQIRMNYIVGEPSYWTLPGSGHLTYQPVNTA